MARTAAAVAWMAVVERVAEGAVAVVAAAAARVVAAPVEGFRVDRQAPEALVACEVRHLAAAGEGALMAAPSVAAMATAAASAAERLVALMVAARAQAARDRAAVVARAQAQEQCIAIVRSGRHV